MALWGVEVKPNKPFVHSSETARGRLRVTQATLGTGSALGRCLVQCNVGRRAPVYLAVLIPDKVESVHLELELEEADDVTFSVLGPRSVYLTGYYLRKDQPSDTESYGIDIENTASEESTQSSDDDNEYDYKDSFIDDSESEDSEPSPVSHLKGKKVVNERKLMKKRNLIIDSEDDEGDEDGYMLSVFGSTHEDSEVLKQQKISGEQEREDNGGEPSASGGQGQPKKTKRKKKKSKKTKNQ